MVSALLRSRMTLDDTQFDRVLDRQRGKVSNFGRQWTRTTRRVDSGLRGLGRSVAAIGGVFLALQAGAGILGTIGDSIREVSNIEIRQAGLANLIGDGEALASTLSGVGGEIDDLVSKSNAFSSAQERANSILQDFDGLGGISADFSSIVNESLAASRAIAGVGDGLENLKAKTENFATAQERANAILSQVDEIADFTGGFEGLSNGAQQLAAMGFQAEKLIPTLLVVKETAAALGSGDEGAQRIIRALGQIESKGRLSAEEMNQLADVGVNGFKLIADQTGRTQAEIRDLAEDGLLPASEAVDILLKGMQDTFGGSLDSRINTTQGLMDRNSEALRELRAQFGAPLQSALNPLLEFSLRLLKQNQVEAAGLGNVLSQITSGINDSATIFSGENFAFLASRLKVGLLEGAVAIESSITNSLGPIADLLGNFGDGESGLARILQDAQSDQQNLAEQLANLARENAESRKAPEFPGAGDFFDDAAAAAAESLVFGGKSAADALKEGAENAGKGLAEELGRGLSVEDAFFAIATRNSDSQDSNGATATQQLKQLEEAAATREAIELLNSNFATFFGL